MTESTKDKRVEIAIHNWAPRFVPAGVPLPDVYEDIFLQRGMATLSFDGPGQGEAEYDMPIRGDYEAPVQAVIDYVKSRDDLDPDRIGIMGVSLGGYYSARAAAFDKRITACLS